MTTGQQGYVRDLFALSVFQVVMQPAGQFDIFQQDIAWYATANEASFTDDVLADQFGPGSLDLNGIGDGAWGVLSSSTAVLGFSSGQLDEIVALREPQRNPASRPRASPRPSPTRSTKPGSAANP